MTDMRKMNQQSTPQVPSIDPLTLFDFKTQMFLCSTLLRISEIHIIHVLSVVPQKIHQKLFHANSHTTINGLDRLRACRTFFL